MKVVAIETSGSIGSVASCDGDRLLAELDFERGMEHGRALVPKLVELLEKTDWKLSDVALIAVSQGPGSYTGLRVGIACARTLSVFHCIPVIGVTSLDVLAQNAPGEFTTVCPILDAKRGQIYTAFYERNTGTGKLSRCSELLLLDPEEALARLHRPAFVLGNGLRVYRKVFEVEDVTLGGEEMSRPLARYVGQLGLRRFAESGGQDPVQIVPIYLRRPEAEEKWEKRKQSGEQNVG